MSDLGSTGPDAAVVYLAWSGGDDGQIERFAKSYRAHQAGHDHALVVVWKGYTPERRAAARRLLDGIPHEDCEVDPGLLDLGTYREVAGQLHHARACFLNSASVILADGWLDHLSSNLAAEDVGLVGATGSHESPLAVRLPHRRWARRGRFDPFPNPHLRTNGFMLDLALMRELRWPAVATKADAWELESGVAGVSRQILDRGLRMLVVGSDAKGYEPADWFSSRTFRSGHQENLLIADNRTREYDAATGRARRRLAHIAWGNSGAAG